MKRTDVTIAWKMVYCKIHKLIVAQSILHKPGCTMASFSRCNGKLEWQGAQVQSRIHIFPLIKNPLS